MHIATRFKFDYPLKIGYLWHLNEKKYLFRKSNRYKLSRFEVYIRMGLYQTKKRDLRLAIHSTQIVVIPSRAFVP